MSPSMESDPGRSIKTLWVYLTREEAVQLQQALDAWASEPAEPGWHCHLTDSEGGELTVAIGEPDDPGFARRLPKSS